jgi:multimeric flavodoxin WrbA
VNIMKVLGISGSPRIGKTTESFVKEILSSVDCKTEFISLANLNIQPCMACLGCGNDNICIINDDMKWLRDKVLEADGYVIGSTTYFGTLNALTHCFLERFFQFRHQEAMLLSGKPVILAGVGGHNGKKATESMRPFMSANRLLIVDEISATGPFGCHYCGYGETCKVGGYYHFYGSNKPITKETTPCLENQCDNLQYAISAAKKLNKVLNLS